MKVITVDLPKNYATLITLVAIVALEVVLGSLNCLLAPRRLKNFIFQGSPFLKDENIPECFKPCEWSVGIMENSISLQLILQICGKKVVSFPILWKDTVK